MAVIYRSTNIIPAPLVTLSTEFERDDQGNKLYEKTKIDLNGTFVAWKGGMTQAAPPADRTPTEASGIAWLMDKQNELRDLFSVDDGVFEILGRQGQSLFNCTAKVVGPITFNEGIWVETSTWKISLEAITDVPGDDLVTSEVNGWTFAENEDNAAIAVTHNVSAKGLNITDSTINPSGFTPIQLARRWVLTRTGYGSASGSFVNLPTVSDAYNHLRTETYDDEAGTYSIAETWTSQDGQDYIEEFEVTRDNDLTQPWEVVSVRGTITGLRNNSQTHYVAASGAWSTISGLLYSRAEVYGAPSGTLHAIPKTTSVGTNVDDGIITYNYVFDTRSAPEVPGAEEEDIVVRDIDPRDIYASHAIIGRALGPVIQFMNTYTSYQREASINIKFPAGLYPTYADKSTIDALVNSNILVGLGIQPAGTRSSDFLLSQNDSSWNFKKGIYTRSVKWTFNTGL